MKELFKRTTASIICSSLFAFIIGLILAISPNLSLKNISIIFGIYLIIHGILMLVIDFKAKKYYTPYDGIMSGVVSIVMGVVLIAMPTVVSSILAFVIGIWIAIVSVNTIKLAIAAKKEELSWVPYLLLGIIDLIAAIIIMLNPFEAAMSFTVLLGIIIMVHAVICIVDMLMIKKDIRDLSKAFDKFIKDTN